MRSGSFVPGSVYGICGWRRELKRIFVCGQTTRGQRCEMNVLWRPKNVVRFTLQFKICVVSNLNLWLRRAASRCGRRFLALVVFVGGNYLKKMNFMIFRDVSTRPPQTVGEVVPLRSSI